MLFGLKFCYANIVGAYKKLELDFSYWNKLELQIHASRAAVSMQVGDSTNTNGTAPPPIDPAGNMEMDSSIASPISEGNMSEPMVLDVKDGVMQAQSGKGIQEAVKKIGQKGNRQVANQDGMFFFFFESWGHKTDPVVIWFTGGPGCSSELALFYKNGPFKIEKNSSLVWNEYGWDQMYGDLLINQYMASLVNCLGTGGREMSKSEALRLLRGMGDGCKLKSHHMRQRWANKSNKKITFCGIEAKQPNSGIRKCARVQLIKNGKKIATFFPNDGCLNYIEENLFLGIADYLDLDVSSCGGIQETRYRFNWNNNNPYERPQTRQIPINENDAPEGSGSRDRDTKLEDIMAQQMKILQQIMDNDKLRD
ncbi:hypothetical protein E3N88_23337 [Mikania micrantha]|uniref:Uncharacterized protein n=1 Tax=Mikania micrantha TaxID=192012 RepID=A0A5N6ND02_9ASTR|nr:hypothetical protein E3N88_23337 [Mikania micrantha]